MTNLHQAQSHEILRSWQSQRNDINHHKDFVLPMFIGNNDDAIETIDSMPETFRYGCNTAIEYLAPLVDTYGLRAVLLFPVVTKTDRCQVNSAAGANSSNSSSQEAASSSDSSPATSSDEDNDDDDDDDDDAGDSNEEVMAERLLNEDQQTGAAGNNPFLSQETDELRSLLANDQNPADPPVALAGVKVSRSLASSATRQPKVQTTVPVSQGHDIRLIKGMALKDKYNPVLRLIPKMRARFPKLLIICDVCLCAFTSTGHCCLFEDHSRAANAATHGSSTPLTSRFPISNETTCQYLAMLSLEYARRGCDVIAPSDMMDGRILTIRDRLNENNLFHVSILSYSAKFASAFYGPFRQATNNAPEFGDRRAYQLPPGSRALASKAVQRDIDQGADFVMVKPAGMYLDIVRDIRERHPHVPIAVYQVSGEYSMLKAAARLGILDLKLAVNETLTAFRRAGATIIISYFTPEILRGELMLSE